MSKVTIARLAQSWLERKPIYLDTETTGLGPKDEIVQIALVDDDGRALLDTFVKPTRSIPPDAMAIHGVTNEMVEDAPIWPLVWGKVVELIRDRLVVIYNAVYDTQMIWQSGKAHGIPYSLAEVAEYDCAMLAYANFFGKWNDYRNSYRWQPLGVACAQQGINTDDITAHHAAGDCEMTRRLVHQMAAYCESYPTQMVTTSAGERP